MAIREKVLCLVVFFVYPAKEQKAILNAIERVLTDPFHIEIAATKQRIENISRIKFLIM